MPVDLLKMLQDLVAQLADVPAALEAAKKMSYDQGFADGVASVPVPPVSDKIYSQVELDKAVADAIAPLQIQIADLAAQVAGFDQKVLDAVALVKSDLLSKYQQLEVAMIANETGFEQLLK